MRSKTSAAAVALVAAAALVAGCGGAQNGSGGASGGASPIHLVRTTAKAGAGVGTVRWLLEKEPDSFDLDRQGGTSGRTVLANVCERLFQQRPDLTSVPHLAVKAARPDDTTLVLTLRSGVTFHDGSPMTAADVVWSLKRHAADGMEESDEFDNVKGITKTGDRQVTIAFSRPDALFTQALAGDAGIVLHRAEVEKQGEDYGTPGHADACTGPFTVAGWDSGDSVTLKRYAGYWDEDHRALPGKVVFHWASDSAMVNSFSAGAADGAYVTSSTGPAAALRGKKGQHVYFGPSTRAWSLIPTGRGAMKDARLRMALSLALDRSGIAKSGFSGLVQPWASPVGSGAWSYEHGAFAAAQRALAENAPASPTAGDLARAKKLVKEAGAPDEPIVVVSDGTQGRSVIANAVRGAGGRIGLPVRIETVPPARFEEYYSDPSARDDVDLIADDWYISKADPVGFYDNAVSGSANNWVGFKDAAYDAQVARAQRTTDPKARAALAVDVQRRFNDSMVWIPVAQVPSTLVLDDSFTGVPVSDIATAYPWAADLGRRR